MDHLNYLRRANEMARKARAEGNTPFGAVLVDPGGNVILEQGSAERELHDATAHAEMTLASRASRQFDKAFLSRCTLYTTCEPCPMCSGGIYWANIGAVVYGISEKRLLELTGNDEKNPTFSMGARKVFDAGQKEIQILGPFEELTDEIVAVHRDFWKSYHSAADSHPETL